MKYFFYIAFLPFIIMIMMFKLIGRLFIQFLVVLGFAIGDWR